MLHEYLATHSEQTILWHFLGPETLLHEDMKMCCYHHHLHTWRGTQALTDCAVQQNISLEFANYNQFFATLTSNCEKYDFAYINWLHTPDKKSAWLHILSIWNEIKHKLLSKSDSSVCVDLISFEKVTKKTKGKETQQLQAVSTSANMDSWWISPQIY